MKLKGSYEALKSNKSLPKSHFTDQNLYRQELQKILPNNTSQLISLNVISVYFEDLNFLKLCEKWASNLIETNFNLLIW